MNNFKNAIYVISKLDFNDLAVGAKPSTIKDNNSGVGLQWSVSEVNGGEIKEVSGVKILNFKTNNYKLSTTISGADLKNGSIQFEADILIPSVKADNIFFNVGNSASTGFRFNIKNTFRNGLEVIFGTSRVAFNFLFESNKKYNIVISKDYNVYSLYVDGMIIGHCVSNDFNNLININTTPNITLGASANTTTNTVDQFIGEISNVNISFGRDSNKYSNSFTKYGDHLISRLNFGNLASVSSSTVFTPGLEAVINSPMTWVYSDVTASSEYGKLNGTPFTSDIGDTGTVYFTMNSGKNVSDIDLVNFNDLYKIVYTYNFEGEPEPEVVVNEYTTSALDFDNGLIDKVGTTIWTKEGTANVTSVNKIFGENSFETKALGDSLSTTSNIITGGATPFTIEFYALLNSFESSSGNYVTIISSENGVYNIIVGRHKVTSNLVFYTNQQVIDQTSNKKLHLNEINKFSMSYDGAAFRVFVNDEVELVVGISNVQWYANTHFLRDLINNRNHYGLIDNINIFDGIATKVRDLDQYEEYLVVDLAFDGENNSTKIIDNAWNNNPNYIEKYKIPVLWERKGANAIISTIQPFDGFSSLYLDRYSWLETKLENNNLNVFDFSTTNDFTFSLDILMKTSDRCSLFKPNWDGSAPAGIEMYIYQNKIYCSGWMYIGGQYKIVYLGGVKTININTKYNISLVRKDMVLSLYVNGQLDSTINQLNEFVFDSSINYRIGADQSRDNDKNGITNRLNGYIKNFKIYKGVAVIPENPTGKIQLDFDNNVTDKYGNSTWTNNGVTFDQVNSVKGYSAKFDGSRNLYTDQNDNLKFNNENFKVELDLKFESIPVGRNVSIVSSDQVGSYVPFEILSGASDTSIIVNLSNDNSSAWSDVTAFSYGIKEVSSSYRNLKVIRLNNLFYMLDNNVIRSASNINLSKSNFNLNANNKSYIGAGIRSRFKGQIDNFKSIKGYQDNIIVDKPAVHLPLETNAINIGFSGLIINSVGSPTYTTVDGKKCIKFEAGKYLTINSNNIFNLGTSSDFYIEMDIYVPSLHTAGYGNAILNNGLPNGTDGMWLQYLPTSLGNDAGKVEIVRYTVGQTTISHRSSNAVNVGAWNSLKFYRSNDKVYIELNDVVSEFLNDINLNFSNGNTHIGMIYNVSTEATMDGYMSNFKMFVGTNEIPETYNDKKVLDLDFKPTGKSYLFKDNNNKCVIHPVNITQRDYQDGQYACSFNGTDQYLQLGKSDLLNFGNDDFVINIKFKLNVINGWHMLLCDAASTTNFIDVGSSGFLAIKLGGSRYDTPVGSITVDTIYDVIIQVINSEAKVYINGELTTLDGQPSRIVSNVNFNLSDNTILGRYQYSASEYLNGTIYSIKVLRNTTDLSLLDEETIVYASDEKFTLTNGVEAETIEFTDIKERDVKIVTDTDKVTLKVDDNEVEIPKTTAISKIELFKDYTSQIKDVRVYDIPLQDDDEFIGSVLIDTQYPELEVLDDGEELQVIDVGEYVIKGFIEGGVGCKYIIRNKVENFELTKGIDDYFYDGIDERYLNNYEIYEVESKQSYPLPKHVMERGVISGVVDTGKCKGATGKIKPSDMTAWCYNNGTQRLIGSYPVSMDGTYLIPNLDVHTRYDIIFKHNNKLIENISSSYRKPKRVEAIKNPQIIGIDYEYNQNSSFIKYTWQYTVNATFSSVKLYITENPIIDNTTPFIELGNNINYYNDYNVVHNHQYYVTIVATYEGNEYRSTQMLVNTHDRTPTVIKSAEFNKTTGNVLITW